MYSECSPPQFVFVCVCDIQTQKPITIKFFAKLKVLLFYNTDMHITRPWFLSLFLSDERALSSSSSARDSSKNSLN